MNIDDTLGYEFSKIPTENSLIVCPACDKASHIKKWYTKEFYCEDCEDDHEAITCPACNYSFKYWTGDDYEFDIE